MEVIPIVIIVILLVSIIFCTKVYNSLVTLKHGVSKAWVNIESLLKQRHEQLTKFIEVCKQYGLDEQDLYEQILTARTQVMNAQQMGEVRGLATADQQLQSKLNELLEITLSNSELVDDENFQRLHSKLAGYEQAISDREELYNRCVIASNDRIEQFPYNFIANFFSFGMYDLLEIKANNDQENDSTE